MKIIKYCCTLLLWFGIFQAQAYADSPVWKISKDGNHLFLGGTIHLLTESDYPLPAAFDAAYRNSTVLVFETDLQKLGSPEFQQMVVQKMMYPADQQITQFLKPQTLLALKAYLADRQIPLESVFKLKPGMLSVTLTMVELQRLGLVGTGVDEFYNAKALNDSKQIQHLETVYEQLEFLAKLGEGNEDEFVEYSLNDMQYLPDVFDSIKSAWRKGDTSKLQQIALDPWVDRFPKIYDLLLVERNNNWIPEIEAMLQTGEVELVLVGALHLAGEKGVLAQLNALGYTIENQ